MNRITIPSGNILALNGRGTVLFFENFESPVGVPYYDEGIGPDLTKWVRANQGFGATRHGVDNKGDGLGNWTTSNAANDQTYNFRYTNSGITTSVGAIETIDINNIKYTITFQLIYDKGVDGAAGGNYTIEFWAWDGSSRNDARNSADPATGLLAATSTSAPYSDPAVPNDNVFHDYTLTYTTDPVTDAALSGKDLVLRIKGETNSANIDNIKIIRQSA